MSKITHIEAREIIDSRAKPTISVDIFLDNKFRAEASVPSGASTGIHEALELRDKDQKRYGGNGVLLACQNVNFTIKQALKDKDFDNQESLDKFLIDLDGTENKNKLGANAILGVSLAYARARAKSFNQPLFEYINSISGVPNLAIPMPMMNILNGGEHADNKVDIQEFMVMPKRNSINENVRLGSEIFYALKKILKSEGYSTGVGDEGGFAPDLKSNEEALDLLMKAINVAGYLPGEDIDLAIDAAASEFYNKGIYFIPKLIEQWQAENLHSDFIDYKILAHYRNFGGIRVEDAYLITETGSRLLGEPLEIEIKDVENIRGNSGEGDPTI